MPTAQPVNGTNSLNSTGTLADILVTLGALDARRAEQVKFTEIQSGKTQEDIIKEASMVPEDKLVQAKAQLYNIPYVDLNIAPIDPNALAVLPSEVAE